MQDELHEAKEKTEITAPMHRSRGHWTRMCSAPRRYSPHSRSPSRLDAQRFRANHGRAGTLPVSGTFRLPPRSLLVMVRRRISSGWPPTRGRGRRSGPACGRIGRSGSSDVDLTSRERDARRGLETGAGIARVIRAVRRSAYDRHGEPMARRRRATPIEPGTVLPPVRLGDRDHGADRQDLR